MNVLVINLTAGISLGMVFFLIAIGLSLVLGLMRIINLAHGSLFMLGAYLGITVSFSTGNFILGILAGTAGAGVAGLVIERGFLRKFWRRDLEQILLTFGFVYIIGDLHLWIYTAWPKAPYVPLILSGSVPIGTLYFPIHRIVAIFIGLAVYLGLWWFMKKTKTGAIIRAGADDAEMTSGLGINLTPTFITAFFVGSALAGFAGIVSAPLLGGITLESGISMLFVALAVCIIGGMGSVHGSLIAALLLGIFSALAATYVPVLAIFTIYIVMVIILLVRPSGLLGMKS
jgi:branched-chain amino acid transport system permease protein